MILFRLVKAKSPSVGDIRFRSEFMFAPRWFRVDNSVRMFENIEYQDQCLKGKGRKFWRPIKYRLKGIAEWFPVVYNDDPR